MTGRRDGEAGVSLVEVLVVLAIVGVMAGVSVLGLGAVDRGARAEAEAQRLADRLQLAADEVLVTGTPHALVWDAEGYRFLAWDRAGASWTVAPQPLLGRAHELAGALAIERDDTSPSGTLLITSEMAQAPVELRVAGGSTPWRVRFDGFAAAAAPVER